MQRTVTPELRQAARRELVRQMKQGVSTREARMNSAVPMHRTTVYRLLKRVQNEGERVLTDGRHGHPVKLRGEVFALVREHCQANPCVSSPTVQCLLQERFGLSISVSQLNRVRASLGLTRKPVPREKNYVGNLFLMSFPLRNTLTYPDCLRGDKVALLSQGDDGDFPRKCQRNFLATGPLLSNDLTFARLQAT
jgi:transposase